MRTRILQEVEAVNALAELLTRCPEVSKYDEGEDKEAGALAHAFSDLEASFLTFLEDHLPRLTRGHLSEEEKRDLLLDIGEEFRQILYHLQNVRFYSYLHNENID